MRQRRERTRTPRIRLIKNHAISPSMTAAKAKPMGIGKPHVFHFGKQPRRNKRDSRRDGDAESFYKQPEKEEDITILNQSLENVMHL
jgi:hypothetical protein